MSHPTDHRRGQEPSTNVSLLRRASEGHEDGWRMLVQIYGPVVYRWMRACGVQNADAADVMQETFVAVAGALARFDAESSGTTFRGWLWTIARNKLRDRQRQQASLPTVDGSEAIRLIVAKNLSDTQPAAIDQDDPPSTAAHDARLARLRALECLRQTFDPRTWRMFYETAVEHRNPADVAEEMQVSRWAVYKAKARVLRRLRDELSGMT